MRIGKIEIKRRAIVALCAAVLATAGWYVWANSQAPAVPEAAKPARPILRITGNRAGELLREQAEYFDPTPLFFPTSHNFGQEFAARRVDELRREPGEGFANFPARYFFDMQRIASYGRELEAVPQNPTDILALGDEAPFSGFGHVDKPVQPLASRGGIIEVKALSNGDLALNSAVAPGSFPKVDFAPLEFLVLVGTNGLVGEPLLIRNSGSEQVDAFVRDYLVKSFRLGERLAPGKYVVSVGP